MIKTVTVLATIANVLGETESFLQTDAALSQKIKRAEATANAEAEAAEKAWKASQAKTSELLAKVHEEMAALSSDLERTSKQQKNDLTLLEQSRVKEEASLKATEKKLRDLKDNSKIQLPAPSSFLSEDILAPLRKAASEAKAFAERMKKEAATPTSFLEDGEDYSSKAQKSLSLAQKALSKLNEDLASQKKELEADNARVVHDQENLRALASAHPSFLQTSETYDPLSPQALSEWREKFTAQLEKAREAAGIKTPFHSSLMQMDLGNDEKLRDDERKVQRLQEEYDSQMAKLKEDNAELMAQAKAEIEKAKDMKSKLESDMRASSFVQQEPAFDAAKEQEKIRELQRKWEREAAKLAEPAGPSAAETELNSLIEQQRSKQQAAEAELERLKEKLNRDLETMHKDMASTNLGTRFSTPSFIQQRSKFFGEDLVQGAKNILKKLDFIAKPEESVVEASSSEEVVAAAPSSSETLDDLLVVDAEEEKVADAPESIAAVEESTHVSSTSSESEAAPVAELKEEVKEDVAPAVELKEEVKEETVAASESKEEEKASFVEEDANAALARAEAGLKKLMERLRSTRN